MLIAERAGFHPDRRGTTSWSRGSPEPWDPRTTRGRTLDGSPPHRRSVETPMLAVKPRQHLGVGCLQRKPSIDLSTMIAPPPETNGYNLPTRGVSRGAAMDSAKLHAWMRAALFGLAIAIGFGAFAYPAKSHETLTFLAAQFYNGCAHQLGYAPLTPLEIRYIAKANSQEADRGLWDRLTRRDYFEQEGEERSGLLSFMETKMSEHYDRLVSGLEETAEPRERFRSIGRMVHYLQKLSSPVHVVPIRVTRILRAQFVDRFDRYPIDRDAIVQVLEGNCEFMVYTMEMATLDQDALLSGMANETRASIRDPIPGLPVTWEAFWEYGEPGTFGSYGVAGNNFGRNTEFPCPTTATQRCLLLEDDPIYRNFARHRHVEAVKATVAALLLTRSPVAPLE